MIRFLKLRIAASLIAVATVLHPHAGEARQPNDAGAKAAQLDHISITTMGKGSPVILIPGLSSPRAVWDGVAPEIAQRHRVYLVQINGFGHDDPRGNLKPGIIDGVVAELDGYIAKNGLAGAAVVGHSLGGLIGLDLAKTHPADVGKLMVVDSLPYVGDIFLPGATVAQIEPQAKRMRDKMMASYGQPADDATATATANGLALKPDSRAKVIEWFKAADPRVTGEAMYEDMTTDLRPDVAGIATPITLVYPTSDRLPKAKADAFYHGEFAKAPHVTYVSVDDSAHFVMLDQPAAFRTAIDAFLAN